MAEIYHETAWRDRTVVQPSIVNNNISQFRLDVWAVDRQQRLLTTPDKTFSPTFVSVPQSESTVCLNLLSNANSFSPYIRSPAASISLKAELIYRRTAFADGLCLNKARKRGNWKETIADSVYTTSNNSSPRACSVQHTVLAAQITTHPPTLGRERK
ncbi:hypothetical protein BJX70DRAFT_358108 [Aspergillus crustosus]